MLLRHAEKTATATLKTRIKKLAAQSRDIRTKAHTLSGANQPRYGNTSPKYRKQEEARSLGRTTRHAQLAYAFLRGYPYQRVEQNHRYGNAPRAVLIQEELLSAFELHKELVRATYTRPVIMQWLSQKVPQEIVVRLAA